MLVDRNVVHIKYREFIIQTFNLFDGDIKMTNTAILGHYKQKLLFCEYLPVFIIEMGIKNSGARKFGNIS